MARVCVAGVRPGLIAVVGVLWTTAILNADEPFVPIPETEKALYKFDFKKHFYADEAARQKDLVSLKSMKEKITSLKSEVGSKPTKLLEAIELKQRMGIIAD